MFLSDLRRVPAHADHYRAFLSFDEVVQEVIRKLILLRFGS